MRARKVDTNQRAIVDALRRCGATVQVLSSVGAGVPDLLVGKGGRNLLMEIKDGTLPPSKRALTPDEKDWHLRWRGEVVVVSSVEEAVALVAEISK